MAVRCDVADDIATITIDRPEALNALDSATLDDIHATVVGLHKKARGILLTGAGKAFAAGADISQMKDYDPEEAAAFSRRGQAAFQALQDFPGPVVAAINGFALGGGLELALACDVLLCSKSAKVGLPETTLGVVPGFGGTQRLARRIGPGRAKRMMFTGEIVDAEAAHQMGVVDGVTVPDTLIPDATQLLQKALRNGPLAVAACKRLVNDGLDMPIQDAIAMEADAFGEVFGSKDQQEGMAAFLEKRKPSFRGA